MLFLTYLAGIAAGLVLFFLARDAEHFVGSQANLTKLIAILIVALNIMGLWASYASR